MRAGTGNDASPNKVSNMYVSDFKVTPRKQILESANKRCACDWFQLKQLFLSAMETSHYTYSSIPNVYAQQCHLR